jgi:transcriptional regulator GlxA family with amidase domain
VAWIRDTAQKASLVTSVCTGAVLLAKAGLLAGRKATTHHGAIEWMRGLFPDVDVQDDRRYVDDGIVTSAGVAAGIDMCFHVVATLHGSEVADETAAYIEYQRNPA